MNDPSILSPEAQNVLDAFNAFHELTNRRVKIAAALRAAADQVAPVAPEYQPGDPPDYEGMMLWHRWSESQLIRRQLIAIAAELEGGQSTTTRQYYYQSSNCPTVSAQDARCTCWHDEGTGPLADETEHRSVYAGSWRDHPTPPRENNLNPTIDTP